MTATATIADHVTLEPASRASSFGGITRFTRATCDHCGGHGLFGTTLAGTLAHLELNEWHLDCRSAN